MQPIVSVIIPVFDRQQQFNQAIASVRSQKGLGDGEIEIIIVDDYSPVPLVVKPVPMIEELAPLVLEEECRTKVIRHIQNSGAAAARNTGVRASSGRFIAFLDSDDVWLPNKLANQISLFEELAQTCNPDLLAVGTGFFDPNRRTGVARARLPHSAIDLNTFSSGCWFCPGSALLMSRQAFNIVGLQDENLRRLEDLDWFIRFGAAGGKFFCTDSHDVVIRPSGSAPFDEVMRAVVQLKEKYGPHGTTPLPWGTWNRLAAYLSLEKAVANFGVGKAAAGAAELSLTLLRRPRLKSALLNFWIESRDIPHEIQQIFEQMDDFDE